MHKLYDAGIVVIAGFIVGFDSEQASVAPQMIGCIEAMSVPVCMVGLLTALPNTQLTRRLEGEKRLLPLAFDHGDHCTTGLNFVTSRPRCDILNDYRAIPPSPSLPSPAISGGRSPPSRGPTRRHSST